MIQRITSARIVAIIFLAGLAICCWQGLFSLASQASSDSEVGKTDRGDQDKDLQSQLTELKNQLAALQKPRIVAAGTATFTRPNEMDNTVRSRVKLSSDIVKGLGEDHVVLLTMRTPKGGYPYFNCYWQKADDGFDIAVIDTTVTGPGGTTASYSNRNNAYLIDWAVFKTR